MEEGWVYVRNATGIIIEVSYFNEKMRETVETEVPAHAQQENVS